MDPFARKMIYGSFVYGGMMLVMFAVLTVVYLHTRPRGSDRVVAESTDQARQWTATVMERRCGTDAPFFTHVNLRPEGKDLETGFFSGSAAEGEVFLIEQDAAGEKDADVDESKNPAVRPVRNSRKMPASEK